jgi:polyphosphate kinase
MDNLLKKSNDVADAEVPAQNDQFINRERSWLEFNARVLEEAASPSVPLLERLHFLSIFSSNLDEFFMVRVAGLKKMLSEGILTCESADHTPIKVVLDQLRQRADELCSRQHEILRNILNELEPHGVRIAKFSELSDSQREALKVYFTEQVMPVLTPLAMDSSHPFPSISNLALYLVVTFNLHGEDQTSRLGFVEIPSVLPGIIPVDATGSTHTFVTLEEIVGAHLDQLFLGFEIANYKAIRITRNLDYTLLENNVVDLLVSVQRQMVDREHQEAVRLEVQDDISEATLNTLIDRLKLNSSDVYRLQPPIDVTALKDLYSLPLDNLRETPFNPRLPLRMASNTNFFGILAEGDLLVHHPYESFYAVIEFLNAAASDEHVLAIKQTLYRTSGDSPVIEALIRAAENGKKVTAVIELKARFDEKNNIVWARRLERAGVNVVFGFVGFKTHCKATLVVRKEGDKLARYVHLSTGNYNSNTAKLYTDLGLFTADQKICHDISTIFNLLTGFNVLSNSMIQVRPKTIPHFDEIAVSPFNSREKVLKLIDDEIGFHRASGHGLIMGKMNALVDQATIAKLYEASQAGVVVRLIVRGICCLRPGVPGLSDNIEVISIVDRFLEHSRAYYFHSAGEKRLFLSSADWMNRNMDRRIEIMFPIKDHNVKDRIIKGILGVYWADNVKAWQLRADGTYFRRSPKAGEQPFRAQERLIQLVREEGIKSIPYEKAIRYDLTKKKGLRPVAKKGLHEDEKLERKGHDRQ